MKELKKTQKTVLVLGVPRSGTSMVAGILEILGVKMRGDSTPSYLCPKGSFEDRDFNYLNQKILNFLGSSFWENTLSFQEILLQKEKVKRSLGEEIKVLVNKKASFPIWGWKHPATSITAELYLPFLKNPHFVIVKRKLSETIESNFEFFRINKIKIKISKNEIGKIITFYHQQILNFLKHHPEIPRIFVFFEKIIEDPIKEAQRLADFLGLEFGKEKEKKIRKFVIPRKKIKRAKQKAKIQRLIFLAREILKKEGIFSLFKKFFKYLKNKISKKLDLSFFLLPYFLIKLKIFSLRNKNLTQLVNFVFRGEGKRIIKPSQIPEEISKLLEILKKKNPKTILEIGTGKGGTLFLFSQIASPDAILISIDLPKGKFGGGYPFWKILLLKSFAQKKQKIYLIRANSHTQKTFQKVKRILNGKKLDFLFIDGDHTFKGVKKDFEMYRKLIERENKSLKTPLKETRIVAFHDIVPGPKENVGGVPEFWQKLKNKVNKKMIKEIIKSKDQEGYGIGVIFYK